MNSSNVMCGVGWCILPVEGKSLFCRFHAHEVEHYGQSAADLNYYSPSRALIIAENEGGWLMSDADWNAQFEDGDGARSS